VEAVEAAYQASLQQLRADWQRQLKVGACRVCEGFWAWCCAPLV
jgi:hypothetical protein